MALLALKFERIAQLICVLRFFKWNEYGTVNVLNGGNNIELNDNSTHVCVQQRSFHVQNKNKNENKHSNIHRKTENSNTATYGGVATMPIPSTSFYLMWNDETEYD